MVFLFGLLHQSPIVMCRVKNDRSIGWSGTDSRSPYGIRPRFWDFGLLYQCTRTDSLYGLVCLKISHSSETTRFELWSFWLFLAVTYLLLVSYPFEPNLFHSMLLDPKFHGSNWTFKNKHKCVCLSSARLHIGHLKDPFPYVSICRRWALSDFSTASQRSRST